MKRLSLVCKMGLAALLALLTFQISAKADNERTVTLSKATLLDKIKGGWAAQVIGCAYGGPTEFCYRGTMIPDDRVIEYPDGHLKYYFDNIPTLYDDIYMDLTFVDVYNRMGLDAPVEEFAKAFAYADYNLWHANMLGRFNVKRGIMPPESGHWRNNPHADCIDYQIEADFAGLMSPGMINASTDISDKIGHIMNYGDGWYGGVFVGAMYAEAFIENDILTVVERGLSVIPKQSKFYRCISDVIAWYKEDPTDWKRCWQLYNDKWSKDVGCPELVMEAGNIDATMNSAYVVMGLLYGNGDFGKTLEISCRCGQDSDCNPATAGGILATMMGYSNIPEYWMPNLREVEDIDFVYTTLSLSKTYDISYDLAEKMIVRYGGSIGDNDVTIRVEEPQVVRFEESFPGYNPHLLVSDVENIGTENCTMESFVFEGVGIAFHGSLTAPNTTYEAQLEAYIDGEFDQQMVLSTDYRKRTDVIYWKYDLPEGRHTITFKLVNPQNGVNIKSDKVIYYTRGADDSLKTIQPIVFNKWSEETSNGASLDFNNDGIQDIIMAGTMNKTKVLRGTGIANAQEAYIEVSDVGDLDKISFFPQIVPVDFNHDGFVDVLAFDSDPVNYSTNDNGAEGIFLGDGTGSFRLAKTKIINATSHTQDNNFDWKRIKNADFADFNNDGLLDIVVCSDRIGYGIVLLGEKPDENYDFVFLKAIYDTSAKYRVAAKSKTVNTAYVKAYDLNSDGYTDFIINGCTTQQKAFFFLNDPENPGVFTPHELPDYRESPSFDIADLNCDGMPEIYLAGGYDNREGWKNRIYTPKFPDETVYSLFYTLPWQNNDVCMGFRSSAFLDWNGDGYADILETGRSDTELDNGAILDSRATKIRINYGTGKAWAEPILTAGSNRNSTIITDINNDGIPDYLRNGSNDLAVDIKGLVYPSGNIMTATINPNTPTYSPQAPTLQPVEVTDSTAIIAWSEPANALGCETYEYVVLNSNNNIVAGSGLSVFPSGQRKTFTHGNACQAKQIKLCLPRGKYTIGVQTIGTNYCGSPFATASFEISDPTAVADIEASEQSHPSTAYDLMGRKTTPNTKGVVISTNGKRLVR